MNYSQSLQSMGFSTNKTNCPGCILDRENEMKAQMGQNGGVALIRMLSIDKKSWLELKQVLSIADRNVPIMDRGRRNILIELPSDSIETIEELEVVNGCDSFTPLSSVVLLSPQMTRTLLTDPKNLRRADINPASTKENIVQYQGHSFVGINVSKPHNYVGRFIFHCGMKDGSKHSFGTLDFKIVSREYFFKEEEKLCMLPQQTEVVNWGHNGNCETTKALFTSVKRPRRRSTVSDYSVRHLMHNSQFQQDRGANMGGVGSIPGKRGTSHEGGGNMDSLIEAVSQVSENQQQQDGTDPNTKGLPTGLQMPKLPIPQPANVPTALSNAINNNSLGVGNPNVPNSEGNVVGTTAPMTMGPQPSCKPVNLNPVASSSSGGSEYSRIRMVDNAITIPTSVVPVRGNVQNTTNMMQQPRNTIPMQQSTDYSQKIINELGKGHMAKVGQVRSILNQVGSNMRIFQRCGDAGRNLFHLAMVYNSHPQAVRALTERANVEFKVTIDDMGMTPLHIAFESPNVNPDVVELMLESVHVKAAWAKDRVGRTCLHYAATVHCHPKCIRHLMNGMPKEYRELEDKFGSTALDYAFASNAPASIIFEIMTNCSNDMSLASIPQKFAREDKKEIFNDIAGLMMTQRSARQIYLLDPNVLNTTNAQGASSRFSKFIDLSNKCVEWMGLFEAEPENMPPTHPHIPTLPSVPLPMSLPGIAQLPPGVQPVLPHLQGMSFQIPHQLQLPPGAMSGLPGIPHLGGISLPGIQAMSLPPHNGMQAINISNPSPPHHPHHHSTEIGSSSMRPNVSAAVPSNEEVPTMSLQHGLGSSLPMMSQPTNQG
eukprot:TRINITY_DN189352_c0_g2_i1.p1 TRINITY_DN189352_c0_g2~~TRINITY_DN189352_c0_g2_i1.p1  ORF type:complete len:825 (+),score=252.26 TRINITY_DN189352_c0_g2_i1:148-2622(+)